MPVWHRLVVLPGAFWWRAREWARVDVARLKMKLAAWTSYRRLSSVADAVFLLNEEILAGSAVMVRGRFRVIPISVWFGSTTSWPLRVSRYKPDTTEPAMRAV